MCFTSIKSAKVSSSTLSWGISRLTMPTWLGCVSIQGLPLRGGPTGPYLEGFPHHQKKRSSLELCAFVPMYVKKKDQHKSATYHYLNTTSITSPKCSLQHHDLLLHLWHDAASHYTLEQILSLAPSPPLLKTLQFTLPLTLTTISIT